jgi:excisionase family DNA binding protein
MITVSEAAKRLKVSPGRVYQLIEAKRLPASRRGGIILVDPADLKLVRRRVNGRPRSSTKPVVNPVVVTETENKPK